MSAPPHCASNERAEVLPDGQYVPASAASMTPPDAASDAREALKQRIHSWAGLHSFSYIDAAEEEAFVAKDFASMETMCLLMTLLQLSALPRPPRPPLAAHA